MSEKRMHGQLPGDLPGSFSPIWFPHLTVLTSLALSLSTQESLDKNVISLFALCLELLFVFIKCAEVAGGENHSPASRWSARKAGRWTDRHRSACVSLSLCLCLSSPLSTIWYPPGIYFGKKREVWSLEMLPLSQDPSIKPHPRMSPSLGDPSGSKPPGAQ